MESLIKMHESPADTDSKMNDANLKSFLDSKKKEYGKDGLREMLREQLADVESEIIVEKLMPESIDDMSKESFELLLESIKTMNNYHLVSYIKCWYQLS